MSPKLKKERYTTVIHERVKTLLKEHRITQSYLAEQLKIDCPNLCRSLRKGEIQKEWLKNIADYFNVSIRYLSGETEIKYPQIYDEREKYNDRELLNLYGFSRHFNNSYKLDTLTDRQLDELDYILMYMFEHPEKSVIENIRTEYIDYLKRIDESDKSGSWIENPVNLFNKDNSSKNKL